MKKILSIVAIALLTVLMLSSICAFAQGITPYASDIINNYGVTVLPKSGGVMKASASIACYRIVDKVGFKSIKIQEKNGSTWTTVKTASSKYAYNAFSHAYSISYTGTIGKLYRAVVSFRVEDSDLSAAITRTASTSGIAAHS